MFPGIAGIAGFAGSAAPAAVGDVLAYRITSGDTSSTAAHYNAEAYDVGGWHDTASNSENFTVPSGVEYVRAIANQRRGGGVIIDAILKDGSSFPGMFFELISETAGADAANAATAIVAVSSGEVFTINPGGTDDGGVYTEVDSWFAIEKYSSSLKMAHVRRSSTLPIVTGTTTTINWPTETRDTDNWHTAHASTVTMTIASPCVVTWNSHGLADGSPVVFTTTGALPTGLTAGTVYYVVSSAANTFRVAASPGGTAINTSGSQSGVHTATNNSRLVVPSGVSLVRISASLRFGATGTQVVLSGLKNAASAVGLFRKDFQDRESINGVSAILAVSPGDYFECQAFIANNTNLDNDDATWFQIEEIDAATKYALVNKSGTQAISGATFTAVAFGAETADTHASHDNSSNNSRLTVPSGQGITQARLSFNLTSASTANQIIAEVRKNGSSTPVPGLPRQETDTTGTDALNGFGAWIDVTAGDYFELFVFSDAQTLPVSDTTWFCIEYR